MTMQNGRMYVAGPGGWEEIGRIAGWTALSVPVPTEPQQILSGLTTPEDLLRTTERRELSAVVAIDPAVGAADLLALWSGQRPTVSIERRLRSERGVRPPTGAGSRKNPASPYPTRASHARARAHRSALERRDRRRARAGWPPLGPYSAVVLRLTIPNARITAHQAGREVALAFSNLAGTATAVGGSIRSIVEAMAGAPPRFPREVVGAVVAHPPTAGARELAAELSQYRQCSCRACSIHQRAMADVDDLRSIPWTTERIRTYDPPETHRDRIVVDDETGQNRLDSSGRGGSWAEFLRRVDELIDDPPEPGPALQDGNDQR